MAYGQSSGVDTYQPFAQDLVLDALERCQIYAPETKHMTSARRSANLILTSKWSNRGINLWRMDAEPTIIPLPEGILSFNLTQDVVAMFDTYCRQYPMNQPNSLTLDFSTTIGSASVLIGIPNAGVAVGNYINIAVQVSVGGLILYGFYPVISTPSPNSVTISAASVAAGLVTSGGTVPAFTTTNGSATITVLLANHGLLAGQPFVVPVATTVGSLAIQGSYTVNTVVDMNRFTITANANANSGQTVLENSGQAYIATQTQNASPTDVLMTPISRNDYAAQSNKLNPGRPNLYWYEKQIIPIIKIWPVTDNTGPYELRTYLMRQIETVNPTGGETLNLPQRMLYPFTAELASDLSIKFAPKSYPLLKAEAQEAWNDASATDVENVTTSIMPQFSRP